MHFRVKYCELFKEAATERNRSELDKEKVRGPSRPQVLKEVTLWSLETSGHCGVLQASRRGAGRKCKPRGTTLKSREPQAHRYSPPGFPKQTAPNLQNIKSQMGCTEWIHRQEARFPVCCRNRPRLDLSLLSSDKLEAGTDPKIQNKMAFNCD